MPSNILRVAPAGEGGAMGSVEPASLAPSAAVGPAPASAAVAGVQGVQGVQGVSGTGAQPADQPALLLSTSGPSAHWLADLERQARTLLEQGRPDVWDALTREFESTLIETALEVTRGRRIEAAQKLGIGRNTITRKIQELRLDEG